MQFRLGIPIVCVGLLLLAMPLTAAAAPSQHEIETTIDAYNHLTMSFALLRKGVGPEAIRQDILGNVDHARLSQPLQGLYRELLTLTDQVLVQQQHDRASAADWERQRQRQQHQQNGQLLSAVAALVFPGSPLLPWVAMVSELGEPEPSGPAARQPGIAPTPAVLADRMSQFAFDVSLARRHLISQHCLQERQFITPADLDAYLQSRVLTDDAARYRALAALHQRVPALYLVAYDLGRITLEQHQLDAAAQYFTSALEHVPDLLKRHPVRLSKKTSTVVKKKHTVKNNLIGDIEDRLVRYLSETYPGRIHDKRICDNEEPVFPPSCGLFKDTGFQGYEPEGVETYQPKKKPKGKELTSEEKSENKIISSIRIVIEHIICGVKRCRIVKDIFRNTKRYFADQAMEIACGLHNFRTTLRDHALE